MIFKKSRSTYCLEFIHAIGDNEVREWSQIQKSEIRFQITQSKGFGFLERKIQNWTSHSKWKIGQTDGDNLWAAHK